MWAEAESFIWRRRQQQEQQQEGPQQQEGRQQQEEEEHQGAEASENEMRELQAQEVAAEEQAEQEQGGLVLEPWEQGFQECMNEEEPVGAQAAEEASAEEDPEPLPREFTVRYPRIMTALRWLQANNVSTYPMDGDDE